MRLAIEELAHEGQDHLGGRPVFVKHADTRGQLDAFEGQAVRFVAVGRVVALYGGNTADEVVRLDRAGVPLVTPLGSRPPGVSERGLCTGLTPGAEALALARYAVEEKGVKTMALFADERRENSRAVAESFEREFLTASADKFPKEKVEKPRTQLFGKDVKVAELAKALDPAKTHAVLFAGAASDFEEWRKALPASKVLVFYAGEEAAVAASGSDAPYVATVFALDKERPKTVEFAQRFRDAFKEEPDSRAALAYDGTRLLADALRRAQTSLNERFLDELRQTKEFPGLTGPVSFGSDQNLRRSIFVGRKNGNVLVETKVYEPR